MKKILFNLCLILTTAIVIPNSFAEEQATYAVVDSSGVVKNIIVCTESVCGPNGSWGGKMPSDDSCPNCKLVLQVPANSVTGQNQGGYFSKNPTTEVRYDEQKQMFNQGSVEVPAVVTSIEQENTNSSIVKITSTINSTIVSFGPQTFLNNKMTMIPIVDSTTGATITASQIDSETSEIIFTESQTFDSPKTQQQISDAVANKFLLSSKLLRFFNFLSFWLID